MKGYNRLEQIMDYLKSHNLVTVDQLVAVTDASPATIRRDLIKLDQEGVISRTHGGVTLNRFIPAQPTTQEKSSVASRKNTPSLARRRRWSRPGTPCPRCRDHHD
ncbi:glycerol-3-phosphate regulon repressor [Klebsiella grimontii]|uniref:Glycerol-3-phosphate regulon repressor n=1 Tax=Klebsiella grimontii TaxID=2058152 RepID=A0A7H4P393_9ENTR|nr:glycerol-3-phosphate regulon repressor [Klebsiella grimontii]